MPLAPAASTAALCIFCPGIPPAAGAAARWYWAMVALMFRSAREVMPSCRLIYGTHDPIAVPLPGIEVLRTDLSDLPLMTAQCTLWHAAVERVSGPMVIVDHDVLFADTVVDAFDAACDIGLTWALEPRLPYPVNAGVLFARGGTPGTIAFFAQILASVTALAPELQQWYGDQAALSTIADAGRAGDPLPGPALRAGARVAYFDTRVWNFSPPYGETYTRPIPARIIHFKGKRKQFMIPYARSFLGLTADR